MEIDGLPLARGDRGEAVRDLQQRLVACGFDTGGELGELGEATTAALRRFQEHRGLVADGICGRDTWAALVEAGYRLGDRLLYLRTPMLRGDDVADLQLRLGSLGFDAGRVDGIFGPDTERALKDFQRNAGLTTDGVGGPDVLASLARLGSMAAGPASVAGVRERDVLQHAPRNLLDRRVCVGEAGGLDVIATAVGRAAQDSGAVVALLRHPDASTQAVEANEFGAEVFLGLALSHDGGCRAAYYAAPGFSSAGGRRLAELVAEEVTAALGCPDVAVAGMRLPILRETRMPAVVCSLGPADALVTHAPAVAAALARALGRWVEAPVVL